MDLGAEMKAIQLEIKKHIDSLRLQIEREENCDLNMHQYKNRIVREEELRALLDEDGTSSPQSTTADTYSENRYRVDLE